jgi:LacI family transcriptional regulator
VTSGKKIGVRELAQLARVSIGTVDRALNGRKEISEKTRERILQLAREHGYEPNLAARALSVRRSTLRIGVCIPSHFPVFYDQIREGILAEASRFKHLGVEIVYRPTDHLGLRETSAVGSVLESGVRGLILTPGDPGKLAPVINKAEEELNVRVVCVATDDSMSRRSTWVAVDPRINGMMAAELMANFVPPRARVAVVTGMMKTEDHRVKVEGFSEVFPRDCPGGKVVEVIEGHDYYEETHKKVSQLLRDNKKIDGIYVSTAICVPVCRALEEAGLAGKVKVVSTDLFLDAVPFFQNRTISAAMYQRPYQQGQIAVRLLVDHLVNGAELPVRYPINPSVVLRSNLTMFREVGERRGGLLTAPSR